MIAALAVEALGAARHAVGRLTNGASALKDIIQRPPDLVIPHCFDDLRRLVAHPCLPHAFPLIGRADRQWIHEISRIGSLLRKRADEVIAVDDVDVNRGHLEAGD